MLLKLILKRLRFVPFGAKMTQFRSNADKPPTFDNGVERNLSLKTIGEVAENASRRIWSNNDQR